MSLPVSESAKELDRLNRIYDILVEIGAPEFERDNFIHLLISEAATNYLINEWRFMGKLGMGGEYRTKSNSVDCYPEDLTTERREIIQQTDIKLLLV